MSLADQTLPASESFETPDWATGTIGSAIGNCSPFYFWHSSWNPSDSLLASDSEYASCPFRVTGALECSDFGTLYRSAEGRSLGAQMTDRTGGDDSTKRAFLLREEDSFNHDGLSFEAVFGMSAIGSGQSGFSQQGSGGSSPRPGAQRPYPTTNLSGSTSSNNTSLTLNPQGGVGGPFGPIDPVTKVGSTDGWAGNAIAIRCGGGRPTLAASDSPADAGSQWSWRRVSGYYFAAYPVKNGSNTDLYLELWRITTNASDQQIPRLLCKQIVPSGAPQWLRDREYRMRVAVANSGGNPTLKAYISDYQQTGTATERQCFRTGVFTSSAISVGPSGDGAVDAGTGIVTDSGSDKIAAYTDKTVGDVMGRDRTTTSVGTTTQTLSIVEGLYRLTGKRTDTSAITYNDLFERTVTPVPFSGTQFDEFVLGKFDYGYSLMGMFQSDSSGRTEAVVAGIGNQKIERSLVWTAGTTDIASPTDYTTFVIDQAVSDLGGYLTNSPRIAWHKRPSTQFYNHHPIVSFVGATDAAGAVANTFKVGVVARGGASQLVHDVVLLYALYGTDGSGSQTSMKLRIARWNGSYYGNPDDNEEIIAEKVVHTSGSPPAGYDIAGGTKRTLGLKVERYTEGSTPESAAQYTAYWGGAAITFDTLNQSCVQDGTSKVVTHPAPAPNTTSGRAEGFMFLSALPKKTGAAVNWTDPKFEDWTEGAMANDPDTGGGTIAVGGEGSPTTYLKSVVPIDWTISVDHFQPKFTAVFESGHRYASPQVSKQRRLIKARAENVDKATFDALTTFYDERSGVEQPFYFDFPIPPTLGSNTLTEIAVCFTSTGLKVKRKAEGVYNVELDMVEVFV